MADFVNFQERLGMTDHQVLDEILAMRVFEKVVRENLTKEQYMDIALKAARVRASEALMKLGATEEEAEKVCDMVESEMRSEE